MRVIWVTAAKRDLAGIVAHIAESDPGQARRIGQILRDAPTALLQHPYRGRPGRWPETREYVLPALPWFYIYKVLPDGIAILRLLHGAQDWPPR